MPGAYLYITKDLPNNLRNVWPPELVMYGTEIAPDSSVLNVNHLSSPQTTEVLIRSVV